MSRPAVLALALALIAASLAAPARADELPKATVLNPAAADGVLQPGDVLVKFLGQEKATKAELLIQNGQKAIQRVSGHFHKELKNGDPKAFHLVLYLGKGRTAEAHGGDLKTARVGTRSLSDHEGYLFQVYRPKDAALAKHAAAVGEAWGSTRRMHYLVPVGTALHRSNFGAKAQAEALEYGKSAKTPGGPPHVKSMFCSEFVVATYQAAAVADLLAKNPKLSAKDVHVPHGVDVQASVSSPLAVQSQLETAVKDGNFIHVGAVLIKPAK